MKSYKELQATLKDFRDNHDYELTCKLNAKKAILQAEYSRIMDLAGDDGTLEAIANKADAANSEQIDIWFSQEEPFTCAYPSQQVSDFIDLDSYADSPTKTAELGVVADETPDTALTTNQGRSSQLSYNQATNAILPMKLVLWTLAIVIVPALIILGELARLSGWAGNGVIKLVRVAIPLMDRAITRVLDGIVWLTELTFGDSFDEYSDSYLEIKHLLRSQS